MSVLREDEKRAAGRVSEEVMDLVGHQRQREFLDQVFVLGVPELRFQALFGARASGSVSLPLRHVLQSAPPSIMSETLFRRHPRRNGMSPTRRAPQMDGEQPLAFALRRAGPSPVPGLPSSWASLPLRHGDFCGRKSVDIDHFFGGLFYFRVMTATALLYPGLSQ